MEEINDNKLKLNRSFPLKNPEQGHRLPMIPNLEEIPLRNSDFTVNRLEITSPGDLGKMQKPPTLNLVLSLPVMDHLLQPHLFKGKEHNGRTIQGRKGPAWIFSNWQHRYLRILTCPLQEGRGGGDPWWHFHFWRQPRIS